MVSHPIGAGAKRNHTSHRPIERETLRPRLHKRLRRNRLGFKLWRGFPFC